jgi:predicted RNA-binding Zn-ribbon protein involved in translation (DUF1610 family)
VGKLCIKCGYERQESDQAPDYECPKCGVIYQRAQVAATAARQAQQQLRELRARRRHREFEEERTVAGLFTFGWMVTPLLCQVGFVVYLALAVWALVMAVVDSNLTMAAGAVLSVFVVRLLLEGVMVIFRLHNDVAEVRSLLSEQAIAAMHRHP